ncbi:phosphatidylinositol transfer protein 1-like isoform X1 [Durio zibethinus]|uniref:Phosphatidylinositol transfer protein 1-like isoform X1 n=1 Tax=Durio zibethinus TaxID=66656 RepID=A0A6P5XRP4_DURZI|nr:phosphatidylinositol transfer protein 1-like isoform X1 [Durio zibethinus]
MVQLKEFRIVMPMSLEEYQIAQMYMVMKMQQQSTNGSEGVEVLDNKPFQDDIFGKGQYTSKVYRFQSKAPVWLTTIAPKDALVMEEEAWNAYPRCKTVIFLLLSTNWISYFSVIKCPYFTKFCLTIETVHRADNGTSENVHGLNEEQLAARQVEIIDIASAATDYWSYAIGSSSFDFSKFKSEKSGRGPLLDGWQDNCNPVMTAYKLVTVDAPYWGFGYRLEQALLAGERALFLESHRNCFGWIDEWFGMTMQQMRELEQQGDCLLNEKISKPTLLTDTEDCDQTFSHNGERYVQQVVHT